MRKLSRTISGVTPVAVMAKPMGCPGSCVYCPTYPAAPQSYTPESPAVQRARSRDYDPLRQIELRLQVLTGMGHPTDKVELIVMGGTFLAAPEDYQRQFIKACYDALNGQPSATLEEAKQRNETAANRCVGLCIETRPDWCGPPEVERMLEFGATRVELGVQMLDDEIYRLVRRGHEVAQVVAATRLLKDHGLKVHYHWMPGLPGSTPENDLALSRRLFEDPRFRPDGLKIYPTMVVAGTELEQWFADGRYRPYDNEVMTGLVADIKAEVPKYVRISRVLRDIPSKYIVGGLRDSLRDALRERMRRAGQQCRCIRCREYGHRLRNGIKPGPAHLTRLDYEASGGQEVFLSFEDDGETLFGLLRLRMKGQPLPGLPQPVAMVRELHVYGPEVALKEHPAAGVQHRGLGHALLAEAERLAAGEFGAARLAVLSAVGAKQYYAAAGYIKLGAYMVKELTAGGGELSAASSQ
jgi:elongator complex protein 3